MNIIYHDNHIIAINKPAGLLVHRSSIAKNATEFAIQKLRNIIGQHVYPVHRLDRPTSGVLLFALSSDIAHEMSKLFVTKDIKKIYMAIVRGFTEESGIIDNPLRKIIDRYGKPITKTDEKQEAVTYYKRLSTIELPFHVDKYPTSRYSIIELKPQTGRRHQLRRHLKHISHPIIGDPKYGKSLHNNFFQSHFNCKRLLLTAISIGFKHPFTNKQVTISATPDDSFMSTTKQFKFKIDNYISNIKNG